MSAEDRFTHAYHRNHSFLAEHFQPPATSPGGSREYADVSGFSERVGTMKERLSARTGKPRPSTDAITALGAGLPATMRPLLFDEGRTPPALDDWADDSRPWLDSIIDNSFVSMITEFVFWGIVTAGMPL